MMKLAFGNGRLKLAGLCLLLGLCVTSSAGAAAPDIRWRRGPGTATHFAFETLAVSHDGQNLAVPARPASSGTNYIQLWNLTTGRFLKQFTLTSRPEKLVFSSDDKTLYIRSGRSKLLTHWDIETGRQLMQLEAPGPLFLQPDGKVHVVRVGTEERVVQVRRNRDGEILHAAQMGPGFPAAVDEKIGYTLSPDRRYIAVLHSNHAELYDLSSGQPVISTSPSSSYHFSPDGRHFLAIGYGKIDIYDIDSRMRLKTIVIRVVVQKQRR